MKWFRIPISIIFGLIALEIVSVCLSPFVDGIILTLVPIICGIITIVLYLRFTKSNSKKEDNREVKRK